MSGTKWKSPILIYTHLLIYICAFGECKRQNLLVVIPGHSSSGNCCLLSGSARKLIHSDFFLISKRYSISNETKTRDLFCHGRFGYSTTRRFAYVTFCRDLRKKKYYHEGAEYVIGLREEYEINFTRETKKMYLQRPFGSGEEQDERQSLVQVIL
jgi:hypothetical protein